MRLSDFDYDLPPGLIAQEGLAQRDSARMMVLEGGRIRHGSVRDLLTILKPGDLIVANDTRVLKARLFGRKDSGRKVDCLIVSDRAEPGEKEVLLRGKAFKPGAAMEFQAPGDCRFSAEVLEWLGGSRYRVRFSHPEWIEKAALLPIPPYIKKPLAEEERYQTVYSYKEGSLAAPTAGLHFTPEFMQELKAQGVEFVFATLHVGLGSFAPIRTDVLEEVKLHAERYQMEESAARTVNEAREKGRRIFAVGTTSVRCLESAADPSGKIKAGEGWTDLCIYPGYNFKVRLSGLLTNFHLPRTTLLLLVSALAGRERILAAYKEAVEKRYRFYSLGDAMLILV